MNKREIFNKISREIKSIKIQGARNIAKQALYAYSLFPTNFSKKKLIALRPTEPMLVNVLKKANGTNTGILLKHFDQAQKKINEFVFNLIEDKDVIYTHCHSTNVVQALIYSKKKGKKFEVYNTETRPLFQGRKTSKELREAGIRITMFVDSGMDLALSEEQGTKKATKIFLGADAILKEGIINKIGSGAISKLAKINKIPLYIIADSWKYFPKDLRIEQRDFHEVWKSFPKNSQIKIRNPAFEKVPKKHIKRIITDLGILRYNKFLRRVKKIK